MATREPELISSGAGLASPIAVESGGLLGEGTAPVRARGYWEQVWIRFRRDKFAIASGVFIVLMVLAGFVGGPVAAHFLGHGPNDPFAGGVVQDVNSLPAGQPVGPWTHVSLIPYPGATGHFGTTLFILGGSDTLARDEFLRLLYGTQATLEVAVGAMIIGM